MKRHLMGALCLCLYARAQIRIVVYADTLFFVLYTFFGPIQHEWYGHTNVFFFVSVCDQITNLGLITI